MPIVLNTNVGRNPYKDGVRKFGRAEAISSEAIVWDGANGYDGWLDSEEDISVVSDNPADTVGGAGVSYIQFTGQGEDGIEKTYSATLNGITPVLLSSTDSGVKFNCIYTAQCFNTEGINQSPLASEDCANTGTITISSAITGKTMALILPNLGRTQMMIYRVPSDHFGLFEKIDLYPTSGKPLVARLMARDSLELSWICVGQIDFDGTIAKIVHPFPDYISPLTDLCLVAVPEQSGTNISAQFWLQKKKIKIGVDSE